MRIKESGIRREGRGMATAERVVKLFALFVVIGTAALIMAHYHLLPGVL